MKFAIKRDGFSSQLLWTKTVTKPTLICNTLPRNATSLFTSFANMNPFSSFSTPSLPFVLTWLTDLIYSCSIPSVIQITTQIHVVLPPNLTQTRVLLSISFASELCSSQFSKQRCTWQRQEGVGSWEVHLQALLPGEIHVLTYHATQSSLRSLLKGAVQVQGTVNYIAFVIRP